MTRQIALRSLKIGGGAPISVQTMGNSDPHNYSALSAELHSFEEAGADIARFTVPDPEAAKNLIALREVSRIPLVADIHFDYRLAILCADGGIDKIRINPGNIGSPDRVHAVAKACLKNNTPIRIGVNSGSLEKSLLEKYGAPTPEALVESGLKQAEMLESFDFGDIVLSIKASSVNNMIAANRLLHEKCDYPIHLGVTEAGGGLPAVVKSSIGIGTLLAEGIGDTLRVSLSDSPVEEIAAGLTILRSLEMRGGVNIVSCPTCGRTQVDVIGISKALREKYSALSLPNGKQLTVACMGCIVNGPGEAREADLGIAGGKDEWLFFRHGEIVEKWPAEEALSRLIAEIDKLLKGMND